MRSLDQYRFRGPGEPGSTNAWQLYDPCLVPNLPNAPYDSASIRILSTSASGGGMRSLIRRVGTPGILFLIQTAGILRAQSVDVPLRNWTVPTFTQSS